MRAIRRVPVSPLPLTRRISNASFNQRPAISTSISTRSPNAKPRGRAMNSSLAVEPGRLPNLAEQEFFANRSAHPTPSNHSPNQDPFRGICFIYSTEERYLTSVTSEYLTPLRQYQKLIDSGALRGDDHQTRIIQKLQDLHDELIRYVPPEIPEESNSNSLVSILFCQF